MRAESSFEAGTYAKVDWRLIPFLFLCYILAYLDRVNVGLAVAVLSGVLTFCFAPRAGANSASGHLAEQRQPDGTRIHLRNGGDEWFNWHETEDGFTVAKDRAGFWSYVRASAGSLDLEPVPDGIVGRANPNALGLTPRARPASQLIRQRVDQIRDGARLARRLMPPSASVSSDISGAPSPPSSGGAGPGKAGGVVFDRRTLKCIVILAAFQDHWDTANKTVLLAKGRPAAEYEPLFNQLGCNLDGAAGSVRDYYLENSYGKVTIEFIPTGWVRLPNNEAWYGGNANETYGQQRCRQMALDAINAAHAAGFNFAAGDSDGDGYVDLLHIIHSGHSESWSGNPSTSMWPRQWSLKDGSLLLDGVSVHQFSFTSALRGAAATSTSLCRIGEICHEIGHQFGLDDLYDIGGATYGAGTWCCMSYGSWGAVDGATGDARRPVHFSAYTKHVLGFVEPVVVHSGSGLKLPCVETSPMVQLIRDGSPAEYEYFLVENRQPTGFDSQLPGGLLIWHVTADIPGNDSSAFSHPAVRLEEADGGDGLASNRYASPNQTWRSDNGLPGGFRDNTGQPDCNAMVYQSGAQYQRNDIAESYSRIRLNHFSASGATMSYDLQTVVPSLTNQLAVGSNYLVSWTAASDATAYELQEGAPVVATSFSDSAESLSAFYENWVNPGLARRSSGGARTGAYSYMLSAKDENDSRYLCEVQALVMRLPFAITATSQVSFWVKSHISTGYGCLRVQMSRDNGTNWITLEEISGYLDNFTHKAYSPAQLTAKGINSGDVCYLRFFCNINEIWGWSGYPNYGFAIDDILLTGIQMQSFGGWITRDNNLPGASFSVTGKSAGAYAYRARAKVGGAWQEWSPAATVTSAMMSYEAWARSLPLGQQEKTADPDHDGIQNVIEYVLGRNGASPMGADGAAQLPVGQLTRTGMNKLPALVINLPAPAPAEVTYTVLSATNVSGPWIVIGTKAGANAWTGTATISSGLLDSGRQTFIIQDPASLADTDKRRFLWFRIAH